MSTNMIGFRWLSEIFASLCFLTKGVLALEGLNAQKSAAFSFLAISYLLEEPPRMARVRGAGPRPGIIHDSSLNHARLAPLAMSKFQD